MKSGSLALGGAFGFLLKKALTSWASGGAWNAAFRKDKYKKFINVNLRVELRYNIFYYIKVMHSIYFIVIKIE